MRKRILRSVKLCDTTVIEHEDAIVVNDGVQAMGNRQDCAILESRGECRLERTPPVADLWSLLGNTSKTFRWIVWMYTIDKLDRQWLLSDKSQDLKRIGWERRSLISPWFAHHTWTKKHTTQVNRVLSGHVPTKVYLQSRGKITQDTICRLCQQCPETRDHLFCCPALRQERIQLLQQAEIPLREIGSLI